MHNVNLENHLLVFYGTECPHCEHMSRLVARFEEEHGVRLEKIEIWHNEENARLMESYDVDGACGGVPFFYNTQSKGWLCGEVTYEQIIDWANGAKTAFVN